MPSHISPSSEQSERKTFSRRTFLIASSSGLLTIGIGSILGWKYLQRSISALTEAYAPPEILPDQPFVWFTIHANNTIELYVPKIEIGQGIHTALGQIAADELEADWSKFFVKQADTTRGFHGLALSTFGSWSVSSLYLPLREAAATIRETLRIEAAQRFHASSADIVMKESYATLRTDSSQSISYGDIVAGKQGTWELAREAPLKPARDFTLIGKSVGRVDIYDKVTGRAIYGFDARMPNMLYGAVARPPRYGAVLKSAQAGKAASMQGVVKIVIEQGFAGVVAERRSIAREAAKSLECVWEGGMSESQDAIDRLVTVPHNRASAIIIQERGNPQEHCSIADISSEYRTATAAHAHLEPQAALAFVRSDAIDVVVSTQMPEAVRIMIARALGVDKSIIRVQPAYVGGGFGRKLGYDVGLEAAMLSRAVGRPVHVAWTREEDMRYGYYRPPSHHRLRGKLDNGRILALEHDIASGDVLLSIAPLLAGTFGEAFADTFAIDPGATTGGLFEYDIPHHAVFFHRIKLPFFTALWRGLGLLPNTFARESFIDELAHAAGKDPLIFRLEHIPNTELGARYKAALERMHIISEWSKPLAPGRAKGIAMCVHSRTIAVEVAEVSVAEGRLRVHNVWAVVDAGTVINPNGAAAQIQGAIIMGLSSVFHEAITFRNGLAESSNFDTYPLLTLPEAPNIHIDILQGSETPHGMGEVGIGPIAAAVGNALFALIRKRVRELPFPLNPC
ncbi:MAG: molybdopterin cofactor-binding domain-containing protein [Bacteroidota bacterium]|nr:molybdopterin-dependent oxidoreductase [Candidatus Kapabacteria bacterium]MDW8219039.1 molybdopterin cofactor-binding domain-containing protein [Bacteroidota bacterium]